MRRTPSRSHLVAFLLILVTACSSADGLSLGINGSHAPLVMGLSRQYQVYFPGVPADSVEWTVPGLQGGSIDSTGRFTAGFEAGEWPIAATAMSDPTLTDTVMVTVVPYGPTTPLGIPAYGVAVSSAGVIAAGDAIGSVRIRDSVNTTTVVTGATPVHAAFAPDGHSLFVNGFDGKLFRIDVATGTVVDTADFLGSTYNLAVRSSDTAVYVSTASGWIYKMAPGTLAKLDSVLLASGSNGLAFGPGGTVLWASTINAGVLYRLDAATLDKTDSLVLGGGLQRLAVAPSGDSVYVANQSNGKLFIVRPSTRTVSSIVLNGTPHGVGLSSDGSRLFVAQYDGWVTVLDRKSLTLLGVVPVSGFPRNMASIPGSSAMLVSTEGDLIRID